MAFHFVENQFATAQGPTDVLFATAQGPTDVLSLFMLKVT